MTNTTFAAAFAAAFTTASKAYGLNLVSIASLRACFPMMSRAEFDAALDELRDRDLYCLQCFEGRHSTLSASDRDGGISEGGRLFVYVCRRETE